MTKIIEDRHNILLNRKEAKLIVEASKNPSYDEALVIVAKEMKAEPECVVIKNVKGKFGRNTFLVSAFVYKTKEDREQFEPKKKVKKEEVKK